MNKQVWNFLQRGRGVLQLPPLGCYAVVEHVFCSGCEPGQFYQCQVCGFLQPWCKGADDGYFHVCDSCWAITQQMHEATGMPMEESYDDLP